MTEEMAMQYQRGYIDGIKEGKAIFEPKIGCKGCIYENAMIYQEKDREMLDNVFERTVENVVEIIRVMPYQFTMGEYDKFIILLNERLDEIIKIHKEKVGNKYV